ncbi:MAG: hypothetical protein U0640_12985 [Phycisphaerales bacterium]
MPVTTKVIVPTLFLAPLAFAQQAEQPPQPASQPGLTQSIVKPASEERAVSASLRLYGTHTFSSDLDTAGDFSLTRAGAAASVEVPWGERGSFDFSLGARLDSYDFGAGALTNGLTLPPTAPPDPWGDIRTYEGSLSYRTQIDDHWGYGVGGFVSSSGEGGADFSDTLEYGGFASVTYASSRSLILGLGLSVSTQLEDDTSVFPIPFIRWKIDDRWMLSTDRSIGMGGVALTYQATDTLRFGIIGGYDRSNFRLASDAREPDGVGRYKAIPILASVTWDAHEQFSLTAVAGAAVSQTLTLDDANGNEVAEDDAGVAPMIGVFGTFRF